MLVSVWGLMTALVLAHMPVGKPPLRQAGAVAARAAVLGAPLMVVLFLLFPRIGPLWGVPQDAAGKTGLSGSMRMGEMASIANDDADRLSHPLRGPRAAARGDVLPRSGAVQLRWPRMDAPGAATPSRAAAAHRSATAGPAACATR